MIYIDICKIHIRSLYLSEKLSQIRAYRYLIIIDYARRVFTYSASLSHLQLAKKSSWNFSPATAPLTRSWSRFFKISIRLSLKATFLTSSRIFLFLCSGTTLSLGYPPPGSPSKSFSKMYVRLSSAPHPKLRMGCRT